MSQAEESRVVADAVRRTYAESGVPWPPSGGGPVPLHLLIGDRGATHVEVAGLNHAAVSAHLWQWGVRWSEIPDPDPKLAGFLYANAHAGYIFVRKEDPMPRRRFSAAHELGHLVLHLDKALQDAGPDAELVRGDEALHDAGEPDPDAMERQANRFAAELLMPEEVCRALSGRFTRRYGPTGRFLVHHIASELLVSREAAAWRLYGLGLAARPGPRTDFGDDS